MVGVGGGGEIGWLEIRLDAGDGILLCSDGMHHGWETGSLIRLSMALRRLVEDRAVKARMKGVVDDITGALIVRDSLGGNSE